MFTLVTPHPLGIGAFLKVGYMEIFCISYPSRVIYGKNPKKTSRGLLDGKNPDTI
jgi:hypothetical protein